MTHQAQSKPKNRILRYLKMVIMFALIFATLHTAVGWWNRPTMPASPELNLTDYQGQSIDLAALSESSPVLVYFWATWCGICQMTSPSVQNLQDSGYPVATIALQSGSDSALRQYLGKTGHTFPVINDENGEIFSDWKGQVTPSFVILSHGKVVQALSGIQTTWSLKLRLWLSQFFG